MCMRDGEAPPPMADPDRPLLEDLRERLGRAWRGLLAPGTRCALALYPDHWNVGDAAIWWGTRRLLAGLGVEVAYGCDPWSYDPDDLRRALPDGPILLLGGGNFGDVYPHERGLRERILADFPDRTIIQLPQSISFASNVAVASTAELIARQGDFTLLVRDAASLRFASGRFPGVQVGLCPDAALAIDPPQASPPDVPVLALWRRDSESREALPPLPAGWAVRDWTVPGGILPAEEAAQLSAAAWNFKQWVGMPPSGGECPPRRRMAWQHLMSLWDELARERTLRGFRILSRGRVVITNRLHAHLLCLLAGIPHVVCDAANGKIFGHRDTWYPQAVSGPIDGCPVRFARSAAEAIDIAAGL